MFDYSNYVLSVTGDHAIKPEIPIVPRKVFRVDALDYFAVMYNNIDSLRSPDTAFIAI